MKDVVIKFLEHMRDDYLELCETDYVNDPEFPFTSEELSEVREGLEEIILEHREEEGQ